MGIAVAILGIIALILCIIGLYMGDYIESKCKWLIILIAVFAVLATISIITIGIVAIVLTFK